MITDNQVRKLMKYIQEKRSLAVAAAKSGVDEKTARKYRDIGKLPGELKAEQTRTWRTRENPFRDIWEMVAAFSRTPETPYPIIGNWRELLASDLTDKEYGTIRRHERTGRPMGGVVLRYA